MRQKLIYSLQLTSMILIWIFVLAIDWWILSLLWVANALDDAINFSVVISIVAIPLFLMIAIILTYVFLGLQRGATSGER